MTEPDPVAALAAQLEELRGQLARYTGETGHLRARLDADSGQVVMLRLEIKHLGEKIEAAIARRDADEPRPVLAPRADPEAYPETRTRNGDLMTNGNEAERDPGMHAVAQAIEEMAAMAAQRRAEEAVLRDAQVVLDNTEWNSLTSQEQEAQIAADEAEEEAHLNQWRAELEEDIERYASDPRVNLCPLDGVKST